MDKEKLLKKYILLFTAETICQWLIWLILLTYKMLGIKPLFTLGFAGVLLVLEIIFSHYVNKNSMSVMPMIISIHDTVEKYEKQNFKLFIALIIYTLLSIFLVYNFNSLFTRFLASFMWMFNSFTSLNHRRIDYLKNKPEGMNF